MQIARATEADAPVAASILREVSEWLVARGRKLWDPDEISDEDVARHARAGELVIGREGDKAVACMYLQRSDPFFWPQANADEALYVHRLAVRRAFAGQGLAPEMLEWAATEARRLCLPFIRLDTELRPSLMSLYENAGFICVDATPIIVGTHEVVRFQRKM
jgi:GNAT superfamily N-acetyltransferase